MINFSFSIVDPWAKDKNNYKHFALWSKKLSTNWAAELQISKFSSYSLFEFRIATHWRGMDHAGPEIYFELFGYMFACKIYNTRHWDYETGTWATYEHEE